MTTREQPQGLAKLDAILLGVGVAAIFVLLNALAAFNLIPSSYGHFSWQAYAEVVYTQENQAPQGCNNGVDDDGDHLVDCADPDCASTIPCGVPAPVMSHQGVVLMAVLFGLIGVFTLVPLRSGKRS